MTEFEILWNKHHSGRRPIGQLLGSDGAKHRFSLGSQSEPGRHAESPQRRDLLLARQNLLAAAALGEAPCWLVQSHRLSSAGFVDAANSPDSIRAARQYGLAFGFEFSLHEFGGEISKWRALARQITWVVGRYDALLLDIAEGHAAPTLWMSSGSGAIFAPSKSGVDIYFPSNSDVALLTDALAGWWSSASGD